MNELVNMLVSKLGISNEQATGGAGLILNLVKQQLGKSDFSQVAQAHPGVGDLIKAAPIEGSGGGLMGMVGKLASSVGGSELGNLASLAGGFEKLGLKPEMLTKFLPIVLQFFQDKGGGKVADLIKGVLGEGGAASQ